jgi:PBSX family phage terminase large subunit
MALSPKQILSYQEANARINLWIGAIRSGKTYSSLLAFALKLKSAPPGDAMIIGVNRGSIQRNVLHELYKFLGFSPPSSQAQSDSIYGRRIWFVGANDEGCVRSIMGSTLALAYVDEAPCIPAPFWTALLGRLSIKGAQLLATGNPEGPAHWLKKNWVDRANELDLRTWNFQLDDNPALDESYKDNLKKEFTGMWYKRYILGEWAVSHGLIYDSYDELNEFDQPKDPPNYYIIGIDYGTSNATAAVLLAVSPTRWPQIRVEAEYYYDSVKKGRQKTDAELARDIYDFAAYRSVKAIYVDPSAASLKLELRNLNLPVIDAKNDVIEGIKVTSKFISQKNLVVHKGCTNLRECMQTYSWDPKAAEHGEDKPLKKHDHIMDALRYAVYTAFPRGLFSHPDENLTIDQLRHKIYGDNDFNPMGGAHGGYY